MGRAIFHFCFLVFDARLYHSYSVASDIIYSPNYIYIYIYINLRFSHLFILTLLLTSIDISITHIYIGPVDWGYIIHRLHLCRGVRPLTNKSPGYSTERSDGEARVMQGLWGMQYTSTLPSLSGPQWLSVVAPNQVLSMGRIELNCVLMLN